MDVSNVDFSDAIILTDNFPVFPIIYEVAAKSFKKSQTDYYTKKFIANGISPY